MSTPADELRLALADDIVRGLLVPGAVLDETELAHRFGRMAKSHVERDRVVLAVLRSDREGAAGAMREHTHHAGVRGIRGACGVGLKRTTSAIYDLYLF
jgi:DNA-binding GntR family transcriptional regulator